jgi:dienelactone hydrolase
VLTAVVVLLVVGLLGWLRPFEAGPDALAALGSDGSVSVRDTPTTIELAPVGTLPAVGLVFSPGARVDSRAYAALLRPIAEAGYLVVILKEPFGLAITQIDQAAEPIADHPEISSWAVGGHSLGGVSAASFAADNAATVAGLLLWASYPNGDLSNTTLQVESISGSNDGLTTPADIERSIAKLPPDTTFTVIDGGVHAFFADYGEQPGDGQPGIDRDAASAQIIRASTAFLARLAEPTGLG